MAENSYPISDHYNGKKFFNPGVDTQKSFLSLLKWQLSGGRKDWPEKVENKATPEPKAASSSNEVVITFINHATYLLQFTDINVLVDPFFSERASPVSFAGPKRIRPPGLPLEKLPPIHLVLVTHNHYDHMDLETLEKLYKNWKPVFVVPLANKKPLEKKGIQNIHELDWWESYKFKDMEVFLTPAQHFSARSLFDRDEALWGGFFIVNSGKKIFWAGDTGYGNHFLQIRERWGAPDLSFVPIGAYEPRWFMKEVHVNPEEAVKAHLDLQSSLSIGMHYGTLQMADEGIDDPVIDLEKAKQELEVNNFELLEVGETRVIKL